MLSNSFKGHNEIVPPVGRQKISVLVPTFKRPTYLRNCLLSLLQQTRLPDEIIVMVRDTDIETHAVVDEFQTISTSVPIVKGVVQAAGHLPPIIYGLKKVTSQIVCITDDDAEVDKEWIHRIVAHYENDPNLGCVGGRVINIEGGSQIHYPMAKKVGKVTWYGRIVGNLYKEPVFKGSIQVDFLMGVNSSYKTAVLRNVNIDMILNQGAAVNYEVDIGLQVRKLGYRILYDPEIRVNHYCAPRAISDQRKLDSKGIYYYSFNYTYIMLKNLSLIRKIFFLIYFFMVGQRASWGIAASIYAWLRREPTCCIETVMAAYRGKLSGIWSWLKSLNNDIAKPREMPSEKGVS